MAELNDVNNSKTIYLTGISLVDIGQSSNQVVLRIGAIFFERVDLDTTAKSQRSSSITVTNFNWTFANFVTV